MHITENHDDLVGKHKEILKTIEKPDCIIKGIRDELLAVRKAHRKWIVVIYRELTKTDGFIITAFTTSRIVYILKKEPIWTKQS